MSWQLFVSYLAVAAGSRNVFIRLVTEGLERGVIGISITHRHRQRPVQWPTYCTRKLTVLLQCGGVAIPRVQEQASRGLFHLADGPVTGVPIGALRTRCTWRYGGNRAVIIGSAPPLPRDCKQVCTMCALAIRAELEKAFKEAVSELA